jgi:hypothetical protein
MTPIFELLVVVLLVVVLLLAGIAYMVVRRRGRVARIQPVPLPDGDATRYRALMGEALLLLDRDPQQAAARARGIVDEAMRRRGFPDRIDTHQRVKDLHGFSPQAGAAYESANAHVTAGGPGWRDAARGYSEALNALLN